MISLFFTNIYKKNFIFYKKINLKILKNIFITGGAGYIGSHCVISFVSMYVFAGYRLLPAVQNIYRSFTGLTFAGPSLDKIYDDLFLIE